MEFLAWVFFGAAAMAFFTALYYGIYDYVRTARVRRKQRPAAPDHLPRGPLDAPTYGYVSDRVFSGKRPIPPQRAKALRENYLANHKPDDRRYPTDADSDSSDLLTGILIGEALSGSPAYVDPSPAFDGGGGSFGGSGSDASWSDSGSSSSFDSGSSDSGSSGGSD